MKLLARLTVAKGGSFKIALHSNGSRVGPMVREWIIAELRLADRRRRSCHRACGVTVGLTAHQEGPAGAG